MSTTAGEVRAVHLPAAPAEVEIPSFPPPASPIMMMFADGYIRKLKSIGRRRFAPSSPAKRVMGAPSMLGKAMLTASA